jgi:molecular chaperone Hsp33
MNNPDFAIPVREPAQTGHDDTILPFAVKALDLRGRIVRLGAAVDTILNSHDYPPPVADNAAEPGKLLGHGHLAMTIDQGPEMSRYQGLVPLEGGDLEQAAHEYFSRSEQIPTRVRLAVGEEFRASENGARRYWRAGGILLQFLPNSIERARQADLDPGDAPPGTQPHVLPEDDAWVEGRSLIATVDDIELIDPALSSERLAYRLFHERGVRVFRAAPVSAQCSCSRQGVETMLRSFSQEDRNDMVENGRITVTCEFCNSTYVFTPDEITVQDAAAS